MFFFFKQKTAYDMRISDWSSDVCSSDLDRLGLGTLDEDLAVLGARTLEAADQRLGAVVHVEPRVRPEIGDRLGLLLEHQPPVAVLERGARALGLVLIIEEQGRVGEGAARFPRRAGLGLTELPPRPALDSGTR